LFSDEIQFNFIFYPLYLGFCLVHRTAGEVLGIFITTRFRSEISF